MSQSRMSITDIDKHLVIRHSFKDVMKMKQGETQNGPIQQHFNIPWRIRISREPDCMNVFLDCMVPAESENWSIRTHTRGAVIGSYEYTDCSVIYTKKNSCVFYKQHPLTELPGLLIGGNLSFKFTVIIHEATALNLNEPLRIFDDDSAKEDSDVTLIVQDQKFHVLKKYLATHSSYFKSLFLGNFSEGQMSEIELRDIDPNDFQLFLELIYGESLVDDFSVLKILHLADFFHSKSAMRRCEYFLLGKSSLSLKDKFHTSIKYKLEELKRKCISQLKTRADFLSIVPENSSQFDSDLWKELFVKSNSLGK